MKYLTPSQAEFWSLLGSPRYWVDVWLGPTLVSAIAMCLLKRCIPPNGGYAQVVCPP